MLTSLCCPLLSPCGHDGQLSLSLGIQTGSTSNYHSNNNNNVNSHANNQASDTANTNSGPSTNTGAFNKKSSCLDQIEKLKINREERRKRMDDIKKMRS